MSSKPSRKKRTPPKARTRCIPLRLSDQEIQLIEAAARIIGKNRADFIRSFITARALELISVEQDIQVAVGDD